MRSCLSATLAVAVLASGVAFAQSPGIREVTASERSLVTLSTKVRYTTMIVLPADEEIVDVLCGDAGNWVISATANIVHVKPAKEGAQTNLNLVGTTGAIYSFLLAEVSTAGKTLAPQDLKVYVTPADDLADRSTPKYYAASQVDARVAALEDEVREAHAAVEAAQLIAERSSSESRSQAPLSMRFPYEPVPYTKPFLIRSIWHDGRFTYVRTDAQELPALYEIKDGEPALVNFQVHDGTYIVPKVLDSGYFILGKQRLAFQTRPARGE